MLSVGDFGGGDQGGEGSEDGNKGHHHQRQLPRGEGSPVQASPRQAPPRRRPCLLDACDNNSDIALMISLSSLLVFPCYGRYSPSAVARRSEALLGRTRRDDERHVQNRLNVAMVALKMHFVVAFG